MLNIIKKFIKVRSIPEKEYNIPDHVFFLAVLESVPDGSKISFSQDEPERWVQKLQPWAIFEKKKQHEPDYYQIDKGFRKSVRELLQDPSDFHEIHLLFVTGPDNEDLFWMNDNFTIMKVSDSINETIIKMIRKAEQIV